MTSRNPTVPDYINSVNKKERFLHAYNNRMEELKKQEAEKKVYELIQLLREYLKNPTEQNGTKIIAESHELGLAIVNNGNTTTVTINDKQFVGITLPPNVFIEKIKEIIPDTNLNFEDIEKLYSILIEKKGITMKADENTAKELLNEPQIQEIIQQMYIQLIKPSIPSKRKSIKHSKLNPPINYSKQRSKHYNKPPKTRFIVKKVIGGKLKTRRTKVKKYKGGLDPLSIGLIKLIVAFVVLIGITVIFSIMTSQSTRR
jgi:hypothetical protein